MNTLGGTLGQLSLVVALSAGYGTSEPSSGALRQRTIRGWSSIVRWNSIILFAPHLVYMQTCLRCRVVARDPIGHSRFRFEVLQTP